MFINPFSGTLANETSSFFLSFTLCNLCLCYETPFRLIPYIVHPLYHSTLSRTSGRAWRTNFALQTSGKWRKGHCLKDRDPVGQPYSYVGAKGVHAERRDIRDRRVDRVPWRNRPFFNPFPDFFLTFRQVRPFLFFQLSPSLFSSLCSFSTLNRPLSSLFGSLYMPFSRFFLFFSFLSSFASHYHGLCACLSSFFPFSI